MDMGFLKELHSKGFNWLACDADGGLFAYESVPHLEMEGEWDACGEIKHIKNIYGITYKDSPLEIEDFINENVDTNTLKGNDNNKNDNHYETLALVPWNIINTYFTKEELKGFFKVKILECLLRNKDSVNDIDGLIDYAQNLKKLMESEGEENNYVER